ncbi:HNH endonuclease [Nocardia fusca]|uniref:HNH endonuclease n=1 Tax=Nocardia fusca TaxID=941183 RepID=UPI0037CCA365
MARRPSNPIYHTREWREATRWAKTHLPPICHWCGEPIDMRLSGRNKWGATVDHLKPVRTHPELAYVRANLQLAHNSCNAKRTLAIHDGVESASRGVKVRTSRVW